jgi:hypothetical protein
MKVYILMAMDYTWGHEEIINVLNTTLDPSLKEKLQADHEHDFPDMDFKWKEYELEEK